MRLSLFSIVILMCFYSSVSLGYSKPSHFEKESSQLKAIVFLSASCPCSQSHVNHLNRLNSMYSDFKLYGVITDERTATNNERVEQYYTQERFQFPIIDDPDQTLVKAYNALKTPHVVLLRQEEEGGGFKKLYEGGVTDQRQFSSSQQKFLAENLEALKKGESVPHKQGRSLGCYIRRF